MEESRSSPLTVSEQTGMDWIAGTIRALAKSLRLPLDCRWEIVESSGVKLYQLMVIGEKKKASKLFSHWELENCGSDKNLQADLHVRLINLVRFVAPGKTKCS